MGFVEPVARELGDLIEYLGLSDAGRDRVDANVQRLRDTFELK